MSAAPNSRATSAFRVNREDQSLLLKTVACLRKAIFSQYFRPGDRLIERELCELTGVSRGSVREALRHLEAEGLIINEPHRGQTVAILDKRAVAEIYQIRIVLEPLAARLAAENATDEHIAQLEEGAKGFARAKRAGDTAAIVEALSEFYRLLFEASGNQTAAAIARTLDGRVNSLRTLTFQRETSAEVDRFVRDIADIARCIAKGDASAAEKGCKRQLEHSQKVALRILNEISSSSQSSDAGRSATKRRVTT